MCIVKRHKSEFDECGGYKLKDMMHKQIDKTYIEPEILMHATTLPATSSEKYICENIMKPLQRYWDSAAFPNHGYRQQEPIHHERYGKT